MKAYTIISSAALVTVLVAGCIHTSHEIAPIHITLDVNLKVDNELDKFFAAQKPAYAEEANKTDREVMREKIRTREPMISELKAKGLVGEANNGFLAAVGTELDDAAKKLMNEENADRGKIFASIAAKQETTSDVVAKRRALRNAERAKPGEFIMDNTGKWTKK